MCVCVWLIMTVYVCMCMIIMTVYVCMCMTYNDSICVYVDD